MSNRADLLALKRAMGIESNVPLPAPHGPLIETASLMEVGDSITVPYERKPIAGNLARATGFKFTQRREGESLRIWRIE